MCVSKYCYKCQSHELYYLIYRYSTRALYTCKTETFSLLDVLETLFYLHVFIIECINPASFYLSFLRV